MLDTKVTMSMTFDPQTEGKIEVINRTIVQIHVQLKVSMHMGWKPPLCLTQLQQSPP